jgi:Uma2 family endonuclease
MAQPATERLLTAEEFMRLPDPTTGGRLELVEGRVTVVTPPGGEHGERAGDIYTALRAFARQHRLGRVTIESGYRLGTDPDTVRGPDVGFIRNTRLEGGTLPAGYIPVPPDLAVEVRSPWDRNSEVNRKVQEYIEAGTPIVWVVDPIGRTVTIHRPGQQPEVRGDGDTLTSADAGFDTEGFSLMITDLFAG